MRALIVVLVLLFLAGCKATQVTLDLDPGFYPSAIAHDPVNDRFFIGSYATGTIAIVRRDGTPLAGVRPEQAAHPVVQLAYQPNARRLWALTPDTVEAIDPGALPVRRRVAARAAPGGRFADIAAGGGQLAYVLDTAGTLLALDAGRDNARVLARLPDGEGDGSLLLLPDPTVLVAARGGALWRVEPGTGAIERVALGASLADVSQLVLVGSDAGTHHVAAFRGRANEIVTLHLTPDARRAVVDGGTRVRFDTPLHGAFDGREIVVLLGRLRHHPSLGGDGRPNLPPRLATYFPGGASAPRLAAAVPDAGPGLVR